MRHVTIAIALIGCAAGSRVADRQSSTSRASLIVHSWPPAVRLPELPTRVHDDPERPIFVIPRLGPPVEQPATAAERARLERVVATRHGGERLAALDRLADALEADSEDAIESELYAEKRDRAIAAYRALIADPGFATYPKADAVLFRAGHLASAAGREDVARDLLAELLAKHASSPLVADANVVLADDELDADPAAARRHLEDAIAVARGALLDYARLRHASALIGQGELNAALAECEQIAANPVLREPAARLAIEALVRGGNPADARTLLEKLDPEHVQPLLRSLAHVYVRRGQPHDAIIVLEDLIPHATDPELACRAYVDLYDIALPNMQGMVAAARAIVAAVPKAPGCRVEADERIGALAYVWQNELWKREIIPANVDTLWTLELDIVTTDARRTAALRDRAYLRWTIAERDRPRDPAAWYEAAAAFDAAYAATTDPELRDGATAARANAATLRTSP